jgi:hypothetical protein
LPALLVTIVDKSWILCTLLNFIPFSTKYAVPDGWRPVVIN